MLPDTNPLKPTANTYPNSLHLSHLMGCAYWQRESGWSVVMCVDFMIHTFLLLFSIVYLSYNLHKYSTVLNQGRA